MFEKGDYFKSTRRGLWPHDYKTYKYFRIYGITYGTQGYKYSLEAFDVKRNRWLDWPVQFAHMELVEKFQRPKLAEIILWTSNGKN